MFPKCNSTIFLTMNQSKTTLLSFLYKQQRILNLTLIKPLISCLFLFFSTFFFVSFVVLKLLQQQNHKSSCTKKTNYYSRPTNYACTSCLCTPNQTKPQQISINLKTLRTSPKTSLSMRRTGLGSHVRYLK